ncbi:MAG: 16S rRNA (cytosine(1402)-N(4))-methyltransferase RsmH [Candidatus Cyclobacteriaceae bacterium M2_1C_046]
MSMYHEPVLLQQSIEGLAIKPNGIYVDATFGGGGHSREILKHLDGGKLYAFDQDEDAKKNAEKIEDKNFVFVEANFRYMKRYLKMYGVQQVDGILADLGVSSHQFDTAERGFSTRFDADLDMRMDQKASTNAREIINEAPEEELKLIFKQYGELPNAGKLARVISSARVNEPIERVSQLKEILGRFAPRKKENKFFAQVFQALRIAVNDEMKSLEELLLQTEELVAPGGRISVMSYHSLEDRLVKNYILRGDISGVEEKDFYGNVLKPFRAINRKPITASEEEIERNSRARSARLRIAEREEDE